MKRTALPDVLTDEALNRFITGVLLDAREKDAAGPALMTNTLIDRTVEQLRAHCPGAYDEPAQLTGAQPWPNRIGA